MARREGEKQGFFHCAADGETVRRFGRDDVTCVGAGFGAPGEMGPDGGTGGCVVRYPRRVGKGFSGRALG